MRDMDDLLVKHRLLDAEGRVVRWPTRRAQAQAVLVYLAAKFAPDAVYTEAEVNAILKQWHTFGDWSLLRRALIDARLLRRDASGREYARVMAPPTG